MEMESYTDRQEAKATEQRTTALVFVTLSVKRTHFRPAW